MLVYGEAGTGKTHIALDAYKTLIELGGSPRLLATEPGTTLLARKTNTPHIEILSMDELVLEATRIVAEKGYPIIDSINWHYRPSPGPRLGKQLAYLSALLRESGGLATAQVSGGEAEPSGAPYILPWTHVIVRTYRRRGVFYLEFQKPVRRILGFKIRGEEVEWL